MLGEGWAFERWDWYACAWHDRRVLFLVDEVWIVR